MSEITDETVKAALIAFDGHIAPISDDGDFEAMRAAICAAIETRDVKTYTIGDKTMIRVFGPSGLTNIYDLQSVFDAVEAALDAQAGVTVKPLVWRETSTDQFSAKNEDYKVVCDDNNMWAFCPSDWPPFGGYPYKSSEAAKAAAQADYAARILSAIERIATPLARGVAMREAAANVASLGWHLPSAPYPPHSPQPTVRLR
jgi:hypothetical protein